MTFAEVVGKTGLPLATAIFKEVAGQDFENNLSFAEWLAVIKTIQNRQCRLMTIKLARERLQPLARMYSDWKSVLWETDYKDSEGDGDKRDQVINEVFSAIDSIEECKDFLNLLRHESADTNTRFKLALPEKGVRLATTFDDWSWLISITNESGKVRRFCLEGMERKAITFDDWLTLHNNTNGYEEFRPMAFQRLVDLAK